jgi:hypothetical protein
VSLSALKVLPVDHTNSTSNCRSADAGVLLG